MWKETKKPSVHCTKEGIEYHSDWKQTRKCLGLEIKTL